MNAFDMDFDRRCADWSGCRCDHQQQRIDELAGKYRRRSGGSLARPIAFRELGTALGRDGLDPVDHRRGDRCCRRFVLPYQKKLKRRLFGKRTRDIRDVTGPLIVSDDKKLKADCNASGLG